MEATELFWIIGWVSFYILNMSIWAYKNGRPKKSDWYNSIVIFITGPFACLGWILPIGGSDIDAGGI